MNISQIEQNVRQVLLQDKPETFLYELLLAYGKPKASITRLQTTGTGSYNLSKVANSVLWKNHVFFTHAKSHAPNQILEQMKQSEVLAKHKPRFLIATDFKKLSAWDARTDEQIDIAFVELPSKFDFFLPWAGMEKSIQIEDSPADVKAAEKMAKLYDLILVDNPVHSDADRHGLNIFLSRLLFCFFAEDTEIFAEKLFSKNIDSHTSVDGSDLSEYLQNLFSTLNQVERKDTPPYFKEFPYVNGGLFAEHIIVPHFNKRSRELLIRCGIDLDWSEINPDIFGSMFQAVVDVEQRGNMGMHYTSVANIMKVIEPLFLDELYADYEKSQGNQKKLEDLLSRLTKLKIFDPACGSGNFLIIAYKELRKLEMEVFNCLSTLSKQQGFSLTGIQLSQFYGIELDDFAHEIAKLALWLSEHQMNVLFFRRFQKLSPTLPLKPSGNIACDNSLNVDWNNICPRGNSPVYVIGNPPYVGARQQEAIQKSDIKKIFENARGSGDLDYICGWFKKAADYISGNTSKFAFVSTNSICQGVQVSILWKNLLSSGLEIAFAHSPFKWSNSAKKNAGVTCVIVGVRNVENTPKFIYHNALKKTVKNINPYLVDSKNIIVESRSKPLSDIPPVNYGSFALDDSNYTLTSEERDSILKAWPSARKFLPMFIGAKELLHSQQRYCVWLKNDTAEGLSIPLIRERYNRVKKWRQNSDRETTVKLAECAHLFAEIRQPSTSYLALPTISSERRHYFPTAFFDKNVIASNQTYIIPGADPYLFGLISSKAFIVWMKAVGGQLETRIRFSAAICYNNFPVPIISSRFKQRIESAALKVLTVRENNSDLTLAELYDPDKTPEDLSEAHRLLDAEVDQCYGSNPEPTDEERLEIMFKLYEKMLGTANA